MISKLRLSSLLLALSLLSMISAWTPPKPGSTPSISRTLKQNTRQRIIQRATTKRAREQMIQTRKNHPEVFGRAAAAEQSAKVYPSCPGAKGLGYAHYPRWDYYSNDIPGNPRYASPNTEENCIALCSAHQLQPKKRTPTPDSSCIGIVYVKNGPCYLKGELFQYGRFQLNNDQHAVDLVGGCAAWSKVVPSDMDAVCCNL